MKPPEKIEQLNLWEEFFTKYDYETTFSSDERQIFTIMEDKINELISEIEKLKQYEGCGKCCGK